jgi:hypothetical protein
MKKLLLSIVALTALAGTAMADDFNNTGIALNVENQGVTFGYANGTHADFADDAEVFSLGVSNVLPVDFGLQMINDGSADDYRLNVSKGYSKTLINLNVYGVAEAHYDFGDSYDKNRLVLSPYVGVEMPVGGLTPYAEFGYDFASLEGAHTDFNRVDSYAALGTKVSVNDRLDLNLQLLQKMDTDFDSTDREFVVGFNFKL